MNVKAIFRNVAALISADLVLAASIFILNIFIARDLGDVKFGMYSFAIAFTTMFAVLGHLGMDVIVTRDVAINRDQAKHLFSSVLFLEILLSIFTFFIVCATITLTQDNKDMRTIGYVISFVIICRSLIFLGRAIFRAFEATEWAMIGSTIGGVVLLGFGLLALKSGGDIIDVCWIYSLAHLLIAIFSIVLVIVKFTGGIELTIDISKWRWLLINTIFFAVNGILLPIYNRIDIVMLTFIKGNEFAGWYNAAYQLIIPVVIIATGYSRALFPFVVKAFNYDKNQYDILLNKSLKYCITILLPIGVGVTLLAKLIIDLVFDSQYTESISALQILIWTGIILFLDTFLINIMEATGKQRNATILLGLSTVIAILLNLSLIPRYGLIGAAIATLITQVIQFTVSCLFIGGKSGFISFLKFFPRPLFASAIMGCCMYYLSHWDFYNLPVAIVIGIVIYILTLLVVGGISPEDRAILRKLLSSSRDIAN